ncbi:hypothetical protein Caci_6194 [Catenulispora acidiphila DSM 44928]|uniref:Uncharacterized protein n=1 Tax=Catenulispora acidiphila (strain DSM 44928 / JCM 14897 / NBRC 102108 / NRRL B-24433 / ID139908) TaxID=479433 RepID=C7QIH1_CATAD|nr:hypothetical protein [Catenulispora acidiphila]ACU75048.1 hypothetical protein Caci_6194 [Catenulispora acidiphila DSM 44928]
MRIAAEGGSVPPAVPEAVARVLEFSQVARAGDLSLILGALSAAELTAGVARLGPRLPEPVIEHVITHGPPAARNTLAWQLRLPSRTRVPVRYSLFRSRYAEDEPGVPRDQDAVRGHDAARRRLLSRAEPAIDRALFGRLEQSGIAWVRLAILRDRVGPGGEPIVPPDLRAKLAAFVRTAGLPLSPEHLADTDTGDAEFELLRVLAGAADLSLALPASRVLGLPGPIPAAQPGWRDQVWVQRWDRPGAGSRSWRLDWDEVVALAADYEAVAGDRGRFLGQVAGLDEAAAREDIPADVRRQLLTSYPPTAWHTAAAPDVATLRGISAAVNRLRDRWGRFEQDPEFGEPIRDLIIRGLSLGTLTAADVIEHAVPASAILDLAWRTGDEILPAARGRADLAEEMRTLLYKRIGDDVPLWTALLIRSLVSSGTVAELVDSTAILGPRQAMPGEDEIDEAIEGVPSANVLLSFARPHVARELLSDGPGALNEVELALLESAPLPPGLVARAFAPDAGRDARRALAANPATPTAVLQRLLHDIVDPQDTRMAMFHSAADPAIRYAALELLEKWGTPWEQLTHFVQNMGDVRVYQLAAAAPTVERLHFLLKKIGKYLGPDTSALLYGRLAEAAGPEPVWDVAVMAAGMAENVSPSVRASMAAGDVEPLLTAAERVAHQHLPGVTVPDPDELCAPHPDDPVSWPLENAVRQHLDNSPDRWRIMVRRLMEAGPLEYAQLVDLVQAVGGGAGEAAEGEP